jgi:NADPH:quinone reductase-like Zn-dependent oxidoreductase
MFAAEEGVTMRAIRLHAAGGPEALTLEEIEIPRPEPGEALVRVHAAAITRDELEWPLDRLPATPSYEVSGMVAAAAPGVTDVAVGDAVYALLSFDRDGGAAEYAVAPARVLAPKPRTLGHVESAAIPLAALTAWQGLFDYGGLEEGERVLVIGATGGVGHFATQLARWRGAYVIGTASVSGHDRARELGADEVLEASDRLAEDVEPVDLVFDTVGGDVLARSAVLLREEGRLVSVAEEPPATIGEKVRTTYFVVEPRRDQLVELARLADGGAVRPAIDSVFSLADARAAFERVMAKGKRGKIVLRVADE